MRSILKVFSFCWALPALSIRYRLDSLKDEIANDVGEGEYFQGVKGSLCPPYEQITSKRQCERAHDQLRLKRDQEWSKSYGEIPAGCSTRQNEGHNLHFNTWMGKGKGRHDLTPICKKAPTVHRCGQPFPKSLLHRFRMDLHYRHIPHAWKGRWGPPRPNMDRDVHKDEQVNRDLIVTAALWWEKMNYETYPSCIKYAHHHHPDWRGKNDVYGVDCSNWVSHVYNLVLGVKFSSGIKQQGDLHNTKKGVKKITNFQALRPGDVVLFGSKRITHVGIAVPYETTSQDGNKTTVLGVVHVTGDGHRDVRRGWDGAKSGPQLTIYHDSWPLWKFSHGYDLVDLACMSQKKCKIKRTPNEPDADEEPDEIQAQDDVDGVKDELDVEEDEDGNPIDDE